MRWTDAQTCAGLRVELRAGSNGSVLVDQSTVVCPSLSSLSKGGPAAGVELQGAQLTAPL